MRHLLALDIASTCGWAHGCMDQPSPNPTSGSWDLRAKRDESIGMRLVNLERRLNAVALLGIDFVVFEAARHAGAKMQGALVVQAEMQGIVKAWCETRKVNYKGYSPSEIKKFATG